MSTEADIPKWLHNAFEATSAAKKDIALRMLWDELVAARAERDATARDMRERCAKVADEKAQEFRSPEYATNQPFSSMQERFACGEVAKAIRALPGTPTVIATDGGTNG